MTFYHSVCQSAYSESNISYVDIHSSVHVYDL